MSLLILECIPKNERIREGQILADFLTLPDYDDTDIKLKDFTFKKDFLKYLRRRSNLEDYDFIHLSGHGSADDPERALFELPNGLVEPGEFPADCFWDQHVALSACELGKVAFCDPFIKRTGPCSVIGPQREIPFRDACLFWINFYSLVLHQDLTPPTAFDKTKEFLDGKIIGAFQFWETETEDEEE